MNGSRYNSFDKDQKTSNAIVMITPSSFLIIECFVETSDNVFAIGKRAETVRHLTKSSYSLTLEFDYIHEVDVSSDPSVLEVSEFHKKCIYFKTNSNVFIIEIINKYSF